MTDIRQLLMEANPVPNRVDVPDVLRAELMAEVHRTPPPRRRITRRLQWPLPTILVALVAAGGVATAAALLVSQDTKDKSAALASGPPMAVDVNASQMHVGAALRATADRVLATTPYPPGVTDNMDWDRFAQARQATPSHGIDEFEVQRFIEHRAICQWRKFWLTAHDAGDTVSAHDAATILREALTWPSMQVERGLYPAIERQVARAADQGDAGVVRALSRIDCNPMPLLPSSPPGVDRRA